jgi:tetratricopeptide (TPR) repeat protein
MFMFKVLILSVALCCSGAIVAQSQSSSDQSPSRQMPDQQNSSQQDSDQEKTQASPEKPSDMQEGESSSSDSQIDISPPPDDAKDHPDSAGAVADGQEETGANNSSVEEFHEWNPHKAEKDVEVGDYYFRLKNYQAALSRYQEALQYKNDDAVANFRAAQCFEKMNNPQDAVEHYQAYLKILPHGPLSRDAQKALAKLQAKGTSSPVSQ